MKDKIFQTILIGYRRENKKLELVTNKSKLFQYLQKSIKKYTLFLRGCILSEVY